jgi:NTE family protein
MATGASRTAVVTPDAEALSAIGKNVLDASKRADAARTGLRQAAEVVEKVRRTWTA